MLKVFFYGNLYIGFLAAGLTWANSLLFNSLHLRTVGFMFFSSIFIYNLDRALFFQIDSKSIPERSEYIESHYEFIWFITLVSAMSALGLVQFLNIHFLLISGGLFLLTFIYLYFFNKKNQTNHPKLAAISKPGILGFVWSFSTVVLPVFYNPRFLKSPVLWIIFILRSFEYFLNGSFFDYRDQNADKFRSSKNIFDVWSEESVVKSLGRISLFWILILALFIYFKFLPYLFLSDLLIFIFYFGILNAIRYKKSIFLEKIQKYPLFYLGLVDGILFLPVIFTYLIYFT